MSWTIGTASDSFYFTGNQAGSFSIDAIEVKGECMAENTSVEMKATLGLTGLTMNAMALIAPGAFLWLTFAGQSAAGATAPSMWIGILFATGIVPGHRRLLRGDGQALSRHRQLLLLCRTVLPQSRQSMAVCPACQVHRRLGLASLLLDLSRRDGGCHRRHLAATWSEPSGRTS